MRSLSFLLIAVSVSCRMMPSGHVSGPVFEDRAAQTGLSFYHCSGASGSFHFPETAGSGAALFDFDGDGDLDVFLLQAGRVDPNDKAPLLVSLPEGWKPGNRLFRNELIPTGRLHFVDVTAGSGLEDTGVGFGVAAGDVDNDGDLDLYVTSFGKDFLYRNDGNGHFTDMTERSGVGDAQWSTSAAFFDYDRDGRLDIFQVNYVNYSLKNIRRCFGLHGKRDYCGPQVYQGLASRLYRNEGDWRFTDQTQAAGISSAPGPGLGVTTVDFNGDGWPDVFVANDGKANHLWINQKNGKFEEQGLLMGTAYAETGKARAGMGVAAEDFDGNGAPDVIVTNLTNESSTLFSNAGPKGFFDLTARLGLMTATGAYTGFGVGWFDYDNDGLLDLFMANGAVKVEVTNPDSAYPYGQKNLLIHNEGNGKMIDVSGVSGPALALKEISRSAVFGDIDNDGDVDILVTNNNGPVRLLLNQIGNRRHWLLVRLQGGPANPFGYGAKLELPRPGQPALFRKVQSDYSYLAANDVRVHFGLGEQATGGSIKVRWLDGLVEEFRVDRVDRVVTLQRGRGGRRE